VLNWAPLHKDVSGSRGIAPRILGLGTRWRLVVSFTPRPLYPQGKGSCTHWIGGWVGPSDVLDAVVKRNVWVIQKFSDWLPGAKTTNGRSLCNYVQLYCYFVSQSSEFYRHNPLCCFSTCIYCCKRIFRYRLSPESFGYTFVYPSEFDLGQIRNCDCRKQNLFARCNFFLEELLPKGHVKVGEGVWGSVLISPPPPAWKYL
jgi:hypothetical protein